MDQARSVQQTSDGGYIFTGYTYSQGAGQSDVYLVKTYPDGTEEWSRTFGGSSYDEGYSVQQTSDGGYIIAGRSLTYGGLYLVKTYPDGTEKWSKTYENNDIYIGYDVKQTLDGGYIIASGSPFSKNPSGSRNRMYILKTDSLGDKEWDKFIWQAESGDATAILQIAEDSFIVAGFTTKTVTEGIITYEKVDAVYLAKLRIDYNVFSIGETNDGIHVNSPNVYVEWERTYGGTEADVAYDVQQTSDGGYILVGHTRSFGAGKTDAFVVKTDSDGIEMWSKAIGGTDWDDAYSVKQTSDGGYVVAGSTESYGYGKGSGGLYDDDVWLIKLGADGSGMPDSDGDGDITTADAAIALQLAASGGWHPAADVSGDGGITSLDALMILTMMQKMRVYVNAPEVVSGTFNVTIDIYDVVDLDSGQFDLRFDPAVVNVVGVDCGSISRTTIRADGWAIVGGNNVRVIFNLASVDGVSGSGYLAKIDFEVTGSQVEHAFWIYLMDCLLTRVQRRYHQPGLAMR